MEVLKIDLKKYNLFESLAYDGSKWRNKTLVAYTNIDGTSDVEQIQYIDFELDLNSKPDLLKKKKKGNPSMDPPWFHAPQVELLGLIVADCSFLLRAHFFFH